MKYIAYPFILFLILASCKSEPEVTEVDAERLVGEFVRVSDNGRGGKESSPLVESITFRSKFCNFTYEGTPMSGKYSVDEGYVYIEAGGDLGTLSLEIVSENQLEGEGLINGTFMREGHQGEYKKVAGGGAHTTNGSSGGSSRDDGSSDADGSKSGSSSSGSSNDDKPSNSSGVQKNGSTNSGNSSGTSSSGSSSGSTAAERYVVQPLNTSKMRSPAAANIALILTIDPQGNVVSTQLDRSKTTTDNQVLVNSVISEVKKQVRYNAVSESSYAKVSYIVKL